MVILRAIREPILGSPFGLRKQMPIPAAAIIGAAAISAAGSIGASAMSNSAASNLNSSNREWQEEMYKKYSSPEALMRQYREAGVNPYLVGSAGNLQGSFNPTPPSAMPDIKDFGSAGAQGLQAGASAQMVNSQVGNQQAETFMKLVQGLSQAVKDFGADGAREFMSVVRPQFQSLGMSNYNVDQMACITIANGLAQRDILRVTADWEKEHGAEKRSSDLMLVQQETSKVVGELGLMSSAADLNRQQIKESMSNIARNFASIYNLKAQGDYFIASAETANKIRSLLVSQMTLQNGSLALGYLSSHLGLDLQEAGQKISKIQASDPVLRGVKYALECIGNVIHVSGNGGFEWSNTNAVYDEWMNSNTSGSSTTVTGFRP